MKTKLKPTLSPAQLAQYTQGRGIFRWTDENQELWIGKVTGITQEGPHVSVVAKWLIKIFKVSKVGSVDTEEWDVVKKNFQDYKLDFDHAVWTIEKDKILFQNMHPENKKLIETFSVSTHADDIKFAEEMFLKANPPTV